MVAEHLAAYGDSLFCICKTAGPGHSKLLLRWMALGCTVNAAGSEVCITEEFCLYYVVYLEILLLYCFSSFRFSCYFSIADLDLKYLLPV